MIFCIQLGRHGRDRPEQTVGVVVDARREKQFGACRGGGRRAAHVTAPIVNLDAPQAIDRDGFVVGVEEIAQELSAHHIECGDGPAESIADQQVVAEESEILRSERNSPVARDTNW